MNEIMEKDIGSEITYNEYHIQYLKKELDAEEVYRAKVKNRQEKNQTNLLVSSRLTIAMFSFLVFLVILNLSIELAGKYAQTEQQLFLAAMGAKLVHVGSIFLVIFPAIIFVASLIWTIWGLTRVKGMTDPKTLRYQRYDIMQVTSEQRTVILQRDLMETSAKNEAAKALLAVKRNDLLESQKMKMIDEDELKAILEEKKKLLETVSE